MGLWMVLETDACRLIEFGRKRRLGHGCVLQPSAHTAAAPLWPQAAGTLPSRTPWTLALMTRRPTMAARATSPVSAHRIFNQNCWWDWEVFPCLLAALPTPVTQPPLSVTLSFPAYPTPQTFSSGHSARPACPALSLTRLSAPLPPYTPTPRTQLPDTPTPIPQLPLTPLVLAHLLTHPHRLLPVGLQCSDSDHRVGCCG